MHRDWHWRHHHEQRRINYWFDLYENTFGIEQEWALDRRHAFAKYSHSCDHHGICRYDREQHKYRTFRARIKRYCERYELTGNQVHGRWNW